MIWRFGWVPLAALLAAQAGHAQPVDYHEAVQAARAEPPIIAARTLQVDALQSRAQAAAQLPDPRLRGGLVNIPVNGPVAFELDRQLPTQIAVGIEQDIPNLAKRNAQRAIADADTGVARAALAHARHHAAIGAGEAWVALWFAQQRAALAEAGLAALRELVAPARSAVAGGSARPAESLEIRRALIRMEDALTAIEADRETAQARLARYTSIAVPVAQGLAPSMQIDAERLRTTLSHNPEIAIADAMQGRAEAVLTFEEAGKRPDFGVSLNYGQRAGQFGDAVSVMGTVTLPIFTGRRQQPRIDAAEAGAAAARAERDDLLRAIEAQFSADLAVWRSAVQQWQRDRDELLPLARERADLETASYSAGRAGMLDVIAAKTALILLELEILDREAAAVVAATRLRLTYVEHGQ